MRPRKKAGRAVWLVVSTVHGVSYGGEWESRRKDAVRNAKEMNELLSKPEYAVKKAVLV